MDKECADVLLVLPFEHLEGVSVTRRNGDNERLAASWGLVLQDGMLAAPIVVPAPAPKEGVAEIVDSLVGGDVDHGIPRLGKILR